MDMESKSLSKESLSMDTPLYGAYLRANNDSLYHVKHTGQYLTPPSPFTQHVLAKFFFGQLKHKTK